MTGKTSSVIWMTSKGINAATISLSNNLIKNFPTELFAKGSPISTIDLSNNLMTEIPENSLKSPEGNDKTRTADRYRPALQQADKTLG